MNIDRWLLPILTAAFASAIGFFVGEEAASASAAVKYLLLAGALVVAGLIGAFGTWEQLRQEARA